MKNFPIRRPGLAWEIVGETVILVNKETKYTCSLDGIGGDMWRLLDGWRDLNQITEELLELYDTTPEKMRDEVIKLARFLEERQFVDLRSAQPAEKS